MPSNWISPTRDMIAQVISLGLMSKSNENTDDDSVEAALARNPPSPIAFSIDDEDRATDIISLVVSQFRGAIQKAGKYPLSLTDGTVPPDLLKHVLNMAAWELVNSSQTLQMVILTEKGAYAPFQLFYKAAEAELEKLRKGYTIVLPSDPTGEDYINAINVPWANTENGLPTYDSTKAINKPIRPVRVGSQSGPVDLQTYETIFGRNADECEFPVNEIGQP